MTVSEIQNHSNTHTHTKLPRVKWQKYIKYQKPVKSEHTKVDILGEKKRKEWPRYKPIANWKPFKFQTWVVFIEYPIHRALCHMFFDESNKLETCMYVKTK